MKMRYPILIIGGLGCSAWFFTYRPFPLPGDDPMLDLVLYHTPNFYTWIVWWYYLAPAAAVIVGGLVLISVWRVWFSSWGVGIPNIGMLPQWPLSADKNAGPGSVVGEVYHPVKTVEIRNPSRLIIPERGFYTGVAIFDAVESGKTSACMHPLAQQILSRQAANPQRRERRAGLPQLSEGRRTIPGRDADFRGSIPRGALVSAPNDSATPRSVPKMGDHQPALSRSLSR